MPDKVFGERICAYLQLKKERTICLEDLVAYLRSIGASVLQLPERIEVIDAIPLTKVGKADKRVLKEDIQRKLGSS
jgi:non-ribosomal peptide synthetase component E (peptide arylation enzyme)